MHRMYCELYCYCLYRNLYCRYSYSCGLVGQVPVLEERCALEGVARLGDSCTVNFIINV